MTSPDKPFSMALRTWIGQRTLFAAQRDLGISKTCLFKWLTGRSLPPIPSIPRLAGTLGVSETTLMTAIAEQRYFRDMAMAARRGDGVVSDTPDQALPVVAGLIEGTGAGDDQGVVHAEDTATDGVA